MCEKFVLIQQGALGEELEEHWELHLHCKFWFWYWIELDLLPSIKSIVLLKASHSFVDLFVVLSNRLSFIICYIALERLCSSCLIAGSPICSLDSDRSSEDKLRKRLVLLFVPTFLSPLLASSVAYRNWQSHLLLNCPERRRIVQEVFNLSVGWISYNSFLATPLGIEHYPSVVCCLLC